MLIEILDENLNLKNTIFYAYGSNESGQLGIDYNPMRNNFDKDRTLVDRNTNLNFFKDIQFAPDKREMRERPIRGGKVLPHRVSHYFFRPFYKYYNLKKMCKFNNKITSSK